MAIAYGWGSAGFAPVSGILAIVLPMLLVREFVRRIAFAHLQVVQVLLLDVAVAVLQMGGLTCACIIGSFNRGQRLRRRWIGLCTGRRCRFFPDA